MSNVGAVCAPEGPVPLESSVNQQIAAFKGGTSLRKLYAGNQGRFSLDLDFSVADPTSDADTVVLDLVSDIDGTSIGPFSYGVSERRGK